MHTGHFYSGGRSQIDRVYESQVYVQTQFYYVYIKLKKKTWPSWQYFLNTGVTRFLSDHA